MDRDQLTEALAELRNRRLHTVQAWNPQYQVVESAAEWARDFPTDEQVEAATLALAEKLLIPDPLNPEVPIIRDAVRAALEAVRQTMISSQPDRSQVDRDD